MNDHLNITEVSGVNKCNKHSDTRGKGEDRHCLLFSLITQNARIIQQPYY